MTTPEQHQLMESDIDQAIEFLNKEIPDWKSKINWDLFDFNDPKLCIAGQLNVPIKHRETGFYMPISIVHETAFYPELFDAYQYMGNIWKQKAQLV